MILGPELIVQNLFNQGWVCGKGWTIVNGEAVFAYEADFGLLTLALSTLADNQTYHVVFPLSDFVLAGLLYIQIGEGGSSFANSDINAFIKSRAVEAKTVNIGVNNAVAGNGFKIPYLSIRQTNFVASSPTLYANTIRSYFKTAIADAYTLSTQYDNQGKVSQPMPWCHLSILSGESLQTSLGIRQYRTTGIMEAQLFYPLETGDAAALTMATLIRNAFKSLSLLGGIQFRTPTIRVIGRMNAEYQVNISCPFYVNE